MLYNQPLAHRFGIELVRDIESKKWTRIEIAVAWVRRSGTKYLYLPLKDYLKWGGFAQVTVGIDIENTSLEGLKDLLVLERYGNIETYIHHNEANSTFHPKVYLFLNDTEARLIVASNNLTEAGFFTNTEAGIVLDGNIDGSIITDARLALATWRDPDTGFAKRLDENLLEDLVRRGYVYPEKVIRRRRIASGNRAKKRRSTFTQALFGSERYYAPQVRQDLLSTTLLPGTVLIMRVRRASEKERRTQIQIPIRVVRTNFFDGITELISDHDNRAHSINKATARGSLNTLKIEIPEIKTMADPVMRLKRTDSSIRYRAYDASSTLGALIKKALLNGFTMTPPASFSSIEETERATWWRFV